MTIALLCSLLVTVQAQSEKVKLELPKTGPPQFALAKASQDGKSIALTQGSGGSQVQTYTVQVPVTELREDKDGNKRAVTVMRTETRQRLVQRGGGRPVTKMVDQTYTVMVPTKKTRINKDGNEEEYTVAVPRTQTRKVAITTFEKDDRGDKPRPYRIADCKFTDLQGKPVDAAEVAKRLAKKSPIVMLYGGQKLDPFYKSALRPDILLMTPPAPKPAAAGARAPYGQLGGAGGGQPPRQKAASSEKPRK